MYLYYVIFWHKNDYVLLFFLFQKLEWKPTNSDQIDCINRYKVSIYRTYSTDIEEYAKSAKIQGIHSAGGILLKKE